MDAMIVGAGSSGLLHALSLRAYGVRIAGVHDPDGEKARALADLVDARVVEDLAAVADSDAQVVAVCSPPRVHVAQAEAVARPGRLSFVEKPVALDGAELARLAALPGCVPVLQWRFGRALRAVARAIAEGELGPSPSVSLDLAWQRDAAYFAAGRASRSDWGCGALLSIGVHAVDAALFALGGEVTRGSATFGQRPGVEVDTAASAWWLTTSGAQIALRLTLDAACDRTRLAFAGAGVSAEIAGGEADPTAGSVAWECSRPATLRRLRLLEAESTGLLAPPLLVPFVGAALRGDAAPLRVPGVADAGRAHRAIFSLLEASAIQEP